MSLHDQYGVLRLGVLINYKLLKAFEGAADFSISEDNKTVSDSAESFMVLPNVCFHIYLKLKHFEGLFILEKQEAILQSDIICLSTPVCNKYKEKIITWHFGQPFRGDRQLKLC